MRWLSSGLTALRDDACSNLAMAWLLCPPEIVDDRLDVGAVEARLRERGTVGTAEQGQRVLELGLVDRTCEAAARRDDQR